MNEMQKISFQEKLTKFTDLWTPKVIAELNNYQFKLAKIQGEFVWHSHEDTDEAFIVIKGEMGIEFRKETIELKAGEMFVVPKGVEHRPFAHEECHILLIEPSGVVNTGKSQSDLTAPNDCWI
jgi:mannose-6-phosphate isomerase-like protein (cupin superfamily)